MSLSSAEAELGGICRGASISLGLAAIAKDLGFNWSITIRSDATAAIGICRRRGLGKVRHLATADLWVQERLRSGDVKLEKVAGVDNPADILTKHVDRPLLRKHLLQLGLQAEEGRAGLAPTLDHTVASFL